MPRNNGGAKESSATSHELIRLSVDNGIAVMTLDDPATRNSMSFEMMDALKTLCEQVQARDDIRVLILTGAGEAFSAGGNMDDMNERRGIFASEDPLWAREVNRRQVHKIPLSIYGLDVPTIAAVNGHAIGGGCDIAMMCDLRIAADKAVFAESFLRVGLLPGDGGAWFLPRVVGLSRAMEMALTCDFIEAPQALEYGLVSRVVASADLMSHAHALAAKIARHPPQIARMTKRLMRFGAESSLADTLEMTAAMQGLAQTSEEHRAAARKIAASMKKMR